VTIGEQNVDASGNVCATVTTTEGFPFAKVPPNVSAYHSVGKVTGYRPGLATGDISFTEYSGGTCVGAIFNSSGATMIASGTTHFTGSNGGNRVDAVVTTFIDSIGSVGAFNILNTALRQ
jgi:hypothetical protein